MTHSLRLPITNIHAQGGYTARFHLGSTQTPVNLILDSGSSVMVVDASYFDADQDEETRITPWVQEVDYGGGGWFGPVANTRVTVDNPGHHLSVSEITVALACDEAASGFFGAQGVVGLAYSGLDKAYDVTALLKTEPRSVQDDVEVVTLGQHLSLKDIRAHLHPFPTKRLTPYFSAMEQHGVVVNQFALYTHRSSVYHPSTENREDLISAHPLNQGIFVLGRPHHHTDLYVPPFVDVPLHDDKYYNVRMSGIKVGQQPIIKVPALAASDIKRYRTNAIVDSGAGSIVLPQQVFTQVKKALAKAVPGCEQLITPFEHYSGTEHGVNLAELKLSQWPDITLYFEGEANTTQSLIVPPEYYWQVHAPLHNQATFKMCTLPGWPSQVILGLPLLNHYYTVFDRQFGDRGAVRFASKTDIRNRNV